MRSQKKISILLTIFIALTIVSCHKENQPDPQEGPKKMEELQVPASFNWESSRLINLQIAVDIPANIGQLAKIRVFEGNPLEGGHILLTGSAGYNFPFVTDLRIPSALKEIYLEMQTGDGTSRIVHVTAADITSYTFKDPEKIGLKSQDAVADPSCGKDCSGTPSPGSFVINDGKTYCIKNSYSGSIAINKGTLKICGTFNGTISMSGGNSKATLTVTAGGTATIGSLSMDKNCFLKVYSNSTVTIGSINLNQTAQVMNEGTLVINSNFNPNDLVMNSGTLTINNGHWNVINEVTNQGLIDVSGDINFNQSKVINACAIISHQGINFNNVTYTADAGFVRAYNGATVNGGANLRLNNKSMLMCTDLIVNNDITGGGSANVVKATSTARINGNKFIDGPIEMLTLSGTLQSGNYPANFKNTATLKSIANTTVSIPVSACNPEGNQPPAPPTNDRDGDGVTDNLDDYPDDPTRAYDNYFPAKDKFGSLAFEDLWPSRGDYDLNDMVVDCNYWYITNAQNKVVDVKPTFYIRAVGAFLQNGFGWQFDGVLPVAVESVSGQSLTYGYIDVSANGTENGQEQAVIIAIDNVEKVIHRTGGAFFNTEKGFSYGISDTIKINIHFNTPQLQTDVGTPPYNPFIIKNMERTVEVHLPDHVPTSLVDFTLFGSGDDDSDPATGRYYKTDKNLPWAISIPGQYDYTWETVEIVYGNLKFGPWAESGGANYQDWYKDLPGYRDAAKMYTKPVK